MIAYKRRLATYPAPYPNGWYKVASSSDVAIGQVIEAECLSRRFAVFRSESGKVSVLDAACPHLGANLGVGGKVVGENLVCPFHHWEFDGEGKCAHIPYEDKVPSGADGTTYCTREWAGQIVIWFDAEKRQPLYEPPIVPELQEGAGYVWRGTYQQEVQMHIQEFAENAADFQHFDPLHGRMCLPFTQIEIPGITINHDPEWSCGTIAKGPEKDTHLSWFKDKASLNFCGKLIPRTDAKASISIIGQAGLVIFRFETELGDICLFQSHRPIDPLRQSCEFSWCAEEKMPRLLVWYVVGNWISQWQNDIEIWENKDYSSKAVFTRNDGPMTKLRRWYKQFYSEHSKEAGLGTNLQW